MRKFKVKNRRKRKYVKKHDLSSSLSLTQSLAMGVLPVVLISIPFIATYLIYSIPAQSLQIPQIILPQHSLPTFTVPEISFEFTLPALPQVSMPSMPKAPDVTAPAIPSMTLPDVRPFFMNSFASVIGALSSLSNAIVYGFSVFGTNALITAGQMLTILDPRPYLAVTGEALLAELEQRFYAVEAVWTASGEFMFFALRIAAEGMMVMFVEIGKALTAFFGLVVHIVMAIAAWLQWVGTQIVNGWNAFVWFIGTPFRALDSSSKQMSFFLEPYVNFIVNAFQQALNEFSQGAETLRQSGDYISNNGQTSQ